MSTRHSVTDSAVQIDPRLILQSLIQDPACLERGLRLFAMERQSRDACMALGVDQDNRKVALYVASGEVRPDDLKERLESSAGRNPTGGRLLVLAQRFSRDLAFEDWIVEPWLWGREDSDDGDVWIERLELEADGDVVHARVQLTPEEIDSLVGSWPALESGA